MSLPTREEALKFLIEKVKDDYQLHHSQMVANAMESYAKKLGENEDLWYITGLVHDVDYFEFPEVHPVKSLEWFKEMEYPEELIHAVEAHAFMRTGVEPKTILASALIACDEMSGLLYAYSLMRPDGFKGMDTKSVKKKFKDKSFAAKVDRNDINYGIDKLGVDFNEHAQLLIETFQNL